MRDDRFLAAQELAAEVRAKSSRNEPMYEDVDGQTNLQIPCSAFEGRVGQMGKTFTGKIDLETGKITIDCAEERDSFWLKIDLGQLPCFQQAPDSAQATALQAHFEAVAADPQGTIEALEEKSDATAAARKRDHDAEQSRIAQVEAKRQALAKAEDDALEKAKAWKTALGGVVGQRSSYIGDREANLRVDEAIRRFKRVRPEKVFDETAIHEVLSALNLGVNYTPSFVYRLIEQYKKAPIPELQNLEIKYKSQDPIPLQTVAMLTLEELAIALHMHPPRVDILGCLPP